MNAAAQDYYRRFRKVLAHVDAHLDDELTVDVLSGVAAFSKFHFLRQFSNLFGIGVHRYVQLVRMKRASYQLAFREDRRIIDVALGSGYESHEAFTRAFKKVVGQTPSEFREQPDWRPWQAIFQHVSELRSEHMKPDHHPDRVRIVDFPETRVAVLEHRGDPRGINATIRKFIDWRRENQLPPRVSATFNIFYDDPTTTPAAEFRLDLCAVTTRPVAGNAAGVVEKIIPAGRCAVLRHIGSDDTLGESLRYLYAQWLPASGEEPRDYPLFAQRLNLFPDVPEHEAEVDLFLPLKTK